MKTKLNLSGYSKSDLAFIIQHMVDHSVNDYKFRNALLDLKFQKDIDRLDEEDALLEQINEKRREASALLAPYKRDGVEKAPLDVLKRASELMVEAQALDKKHNAMIGIKG